MHFCVCPTWTHVPTPPQASDTTAMHATRLGPPTWAHTAIIPVTPSKSKRMSIATFHRRMWIAGTNARPRNLDERTTNTRMGLPLPTGCRAAMLCNTRHMFDHRKRPNDDTESKAYTSLPHGPSYSKLAEHWFFPSPKIAPIETHFSGHEAPKSRSQESTPKRIGIR